ncbi:hypothetical protein GCM10023238_36720 [Streptomyces heliomycini]
MRSITLPGAPRAHRGGRSPRSTRETRAAIEELRGIPQEGVDCEAATAGVGEALRAPGWDGPPVWLHADLMPGKLLVDGGRLTSVIDSGAWGRAIRPAICSPRGTCCLAGRQGRHPRGADVDDATWVRAGDDALRRADRVAGTTGDDRDGTERAPVIGRCMREADFRRVGAVPGTAVRRSRDRRASVA